jgi:3-deoxy-D-manno-octulosonic-acid transferase
MIKNLKKKSIKKILLNSRISKKSYKRWMLAKSFAKDLFQSFDYTFPQNTESKIHLKKLGVKKIKFIGNLKFAQNNLNKENLSPKLQKFINNKKFWCALSTHSGEEQICGFVQMKLLKKIKNLVLILIPRHVDRVENISRELSKLKLPVHIHSDKKSINKNTKIYIVDTYGETNLFFNISKIVFIGKSLTSDGGQNPLDAARGNCSILHGPNVSNFSEIYKFLGKLKISFKINNQNQLNKKLEFLLTNKNKNSKIRDKINNIGKEILHKNSKEIVSII